MSFDNGHHALTEGKTRVLPGDFCNIAGVNSPAPIHGPLNRDSFEGRNPEIDMIFKERWDTVREIILGNPDLCENLDLVMDHFAGYSWGDLSQRHSMSRDAARGKVNKCIVYLRSKILGKQF